MNLLSELTWHYLPIVQRLCLEEHFLSTNKALSLHYAQMVSAEHVKDILAGTTAGENVLRTFFALVLQHVI